MAVAYVDWSSMEFLIAALSDRTAIPMHARVVPHGDPYLSFAKRVGAAPSSATKQTHEPVRDRYKTGLLAIQYGMQAETLARAARRLRPSTRTRCSTSTTSCSRVLALVGRLGRACAHTGVMWTAARLDLPHRHHRVQRALDPQLSDPGRRRRHPADRLHLGHPPRHQAAGAGARRGADRGADRADRGRRRADAGDHAASVSRRGRWAGHELRTDAKIIRYPDRYTDRRGDAVWANVLQLLAEYQQREAPCETAKHAN